MRPSSPSTDPESAPAELPSAPRRNKSPRWRQLAAFTVAYLAVFGGLLYWFYSFTTTTAIDRLRAELKTLATGAVQGVDTDELLALYRDGERNAAGFSDDPRYLRQLDWFETVHRLNPQVWPYTFTRGNRPDTRRIGAETKDREFIYLVDLMARYKPEKAVHFLESDRASDASLEAWNKGQLVERPGLYTDKWGSWLTDYIPVKDENGQVVAVMGLDFSAEYVGEVQSKIRRQMGPIFVGAYLLLSILAAYVYRVRYLRSLFGRYASLSLLRDTALLKLGYASRRRVTVLFADINDFSTICERHTPDEVIHMLNDYFGAMNEIIVASGGWIKQFVGDEIMVIYGAPDEHVRPEQAAVETAMKMVSTLKARRAATSADGFYAIKVGIHSGEVIVGNVGNEDRTEYAAVGDHVNLGSRIMGLSKGLDAPILLSSVTHEVACDLPGVDFIDHGAHPVKGRLNKVRVYEARARGETPLAS